MSAQSGGGNRNTIIIVVVVILLCCCCLAIAAGLFQYRAMLLNLINGAAPTTRALLQLLA
jgi:hypothetical protein